MSDRIRIGLAATAILLWALWAGVGRADVCGNPGAVVTLLPGFDVITFVSIYCGEAIEGGAIEPCLFVDAWTEALGVESDVAMIESRPDCMSVPEPGVGLGLAIGVLCLTLLNRLGWRQRAPLHG